MDQEGQHDTVREPSDCDVSGGWRWRTRLLREYEKIASTLAHPVIEAIERAMWSHYREAEALVGLYEALDIRLPLPPMRGWAVSPDFAREVVCAVAERRPLTILETGSGVSTLLTGYVVRKWDAGRVVSLEHSARWFESSSRLIQQHDLGDVVRVVYAPLQTITLDGAQWQWYASEAIASLSTIDLLVLDGPPCSVQSMARYPALPILDGLLSPDAVIILDDANRSDERAIVARWNNEFGPFTIERSETETGCAILRKRQ